jgi:hypothetical protein
MDDLLRWRGVKLRGGELDDTEDISSSSKGGWLMIGDTIISVEYLSSGD